MKRRPDRGIVRILNPQLLTISQFGANAEEIRTEIPLPSKYKDHPLHGNQKEFRDYYLTNDTVVIYRVTQTKVQFLRIVKHSNLFSASSQ